MSHDELCPWRVMHHPGGSSVWDCRCELIAEARERQQEQMVEAGWVNPDAYKANVAILMENEAKRAALRSKVLKEALGEKIATAILDYADTVEEHGDEPGYFGGMSTKEAVDVALAAAAGMARRIGSSQSSIERGP